MSNVETDNAPSTPSTYDIEDDHTSVGGNPPPVGEMEGPRLSEIYVIREELEDWETELEDQA